MLTVLPEWYTSADKALQNCIDQIIRKNKIDWRFSHDSNSISEAKNTILSTLFTIWEKVDVGERKRIEDFEKTMRRKKQK